MAGVIGLPKYQLIAEQSSDTAADRAELTVTVTIQNYYAVRDKPTAGPNHAVILLIGDADNKCLLNERLVDSDLLRTEGIWSRKLTVQRGTTGEKLRIHLVSESMLGLDTAAEMSPIYTVPAIAVVAKNFDAAAAKPAVPKAKARANLVQTSLNFPIRKRKAKQSLEYSAEIVESDSNDSFQQSMGYRNQGTGASSS